MTVKHHTEIFQGSEEWHALRCGLLTASEIKHIVSKKTDRKTGEVTYQPFDDYGDSAHLYEMLSQRITKYVEPQYISDDMLRGINDEQDAKTLYDKTYAKVETVGFITNDKWGFTIGYSPDALIGDDGLIECKSRRQKYQIETIINDVLPCEYLMQIQTGLLVSERKWCDFVTYSGGIPMMTKRIYPDEKIQEIIISSATAFERTLKEMLDKYNARLWAEGARLIPTERKIEQEMHL